MSTVGVEQLIPDSKSTSVIETVNGSHQFTIKGYSLTKGMSAGKYIQSDIFSVGGYDWAIYFYPDGKYPEDQSTYVSLFIALSSDSNDIRALFELTLMDQSGKGKHKVYSHFDRSLEGGPYTLKYKGSMWGYKHFFKRSALETSDYLKDDCLIVNCTVGVVRARLEGPKQYGIVLPPSNMGQGLKDLLDSEIGCDIAFQVGDETYKAHKLTLAARSPVFRAQFFGPIGNNNVDRIVTEDVKPSIFKARRRWTAHEDVVLISAWLNTSKYPIVGNEQKAAAFWERIAAYYAASVAVADKPKRGANQCKQRWKKINESVNKFVGCYSQASSRRTSGQSEDDVRQMAYEFYFNDHQVKFALEHAWLELRHDQKWCTSKAKDRSKRTKLDKGGAYSSSSNTASHGEEEASPRPPGVKASKGEGKAKKSSTTEESEASSLLKFGRLWEIKEKDTAARERLSKQRLLDSLIAKTDLSEPEVNLKNKLIVEMLG